MNRTTTATFGPQFEVLAPKKPSVVAGQASVGPVGLEPTTYGLKDSRLLPRTASTSNSVRGAGHPNLLHAHQLTSLFSTTCSTRRSLDSPGRSPCHRDLAAAAVQRPKAPRRSHFRSPAHPSPRLSGHREVHTDADLTEASLTGAKPHYEPRRGGHRARFAGRRGCAAQRGSAGHAGLDQAAVALRAAAVTAADVVEDHHRAPGAGLDFSPAVAVRRRAGAARTPLQRQR